MSRVERGEGALRKPRKKNLGGADQVKLLDLDIAKDIDAPDSATTQAGIVRSTLAIMAPERFFGAPASVQTDVYELAVVLYSTLAGPRGSPDAHLVIDT